MSAVAPQAPSISRRRRSSAYLRWSLWSLLVALVVALLVTLIWLAGRYETSQVQAHLERDNADAISDIRAALTRRAFEHASSTSPCALARPRRANTGER